MLPRNFSIVKEDSLLMPSALKTFITVKNRILISNANEMWSTYQTSYANFCCQDNVFRPFTCAHPVIPGFTRCRLFCSRLYNGRYSINNGLGPTNDMCPDSTLKS